VLLPGLVVAALALASCAGPAPSAPPSEPPSPAATPTATSSPDDAATYRQIAAQIAAIRGLDAPDRVEPAVIDRAKLKQNFLEQFDKENSVVEVRRAERIYQALGLLSQGVSLRDLYLELQGSQVVGYYDPDAKELFIVSHDGGLGPTERVTYAHEFTHELQDHRFDLNSLGLDDLTEDSDRALGILSLVEGDATVTQTAWMIANLSTAELGQVAAEASDPNLLEVLARTPAILLETSLFPYSAGATFVASLQARGGQAAVDAAFADPPASTEQILHPEKYAADAAPVSVVMPDDLSARFGAGWSKVATDTMGELQVRVWLREGGLPGDVARTAADGWGGDRLTLLDGPAGAAVLLLATAWDTTADATTFEAAARQAIAGLAKDGRIVRVGSRVVIGLRSGPSPDDAELDALLRGLASG